VPFYLTDGGYGVFVNDPGRVEFEVATEHVDRVGFSVAGQTLEYLVIYGPAQGSPGAVHGPRRPAGPATGLVVRAVALDLVHHRLRRGDGDAPGRGMAERDIPLSVFHFDSFWMRDFQWVDFSWDERTFPDPAGMLARLHERVCGSASGSIPT